MATARFTIYIAPSRGRPGRPLVHADDGLEPDTRFGWRMLAANNREVARSSVTFADVATCVEAICGLQKDLGSGVPVASRAGRADWSWRLRIDSADVAVSSRAYQRRLQCEAACALFVELVPGAELVDMRASDPAGRTRHRLTGPVASPVAGPVASPVAGHLAGANTGRRADDLV